MDTAKGAFRLSAFLLIIATSLLIGLVIPAFYRWTDSDQSRPSALLWQVPLVLTSITLVVCIVLPWLPIANNLPKDVSTTKFRFSLGRLLVLTTAVAFAIPLLMNFPLVVSGVVSAITWTYFLGFCLLNPACRLSAVGLLATMSLPFAWVVADRWLAKPLLMMLTGLPAFVPAALLSRLFKQNMQQELWLMFLLTAIELLIGTWLIRLGTKPALAYCLFVMQLSTFGSLALHMLVLA
jgi:hypothetical protein